MRKDMTVHFCDFCGKSSLDCEVTVAASNGGAICSCCVKIAQDVINAWRQEAQTEDRSPFVSTYGEVPQPLCPSQERT